MIEKTFSVSFRCYYPDGGKQNHTQEIQLKDIPRWLDAYKFTHPNCESITVRVWFNSRYPVSEND